MQNGLNRSPSLSDSSPKHKKRQVMVVSEDASIALHDTVMFSLQLISDGFKQSFQQYNLPVLVLPLT